MTTVIFLEEQLRKNVGIAIVELAVVNLLLVCYLKNEATCKKRIRKSGLRKFATKLFPFSMIVG